MKVALTLLALATALLIASVASASALHRPINCSKLRPRAELHCAKVQLHTALHPPKGSSHSKRYWKWREKVARRWIKTAKYRIAHPPIAHEQLWVCIHNHEGAWNDDTGNGYYGGLQMTENWGPYGHHLVYHANTLSPYGQMYVAEEGWQMVVNAQGYSYARYTWLPQQWYHPDCFQYA